MIQLILSGTYCTAEMTTEFGLIPPSFLPIGNKRLYELQINNKYIKKYITLPSDYIVPVDDLKRFKEMGVKIIQLPKQLSLIQSFQVAIEIIDPDSSIEVLFGDTFVGNNQYCNYKNYYAVKNTANFYEWASIVETDNGFDVINSLPGNDESKVICGHFKFSNIGGLRKSLNKAHGFTELLNLYNELSDVELLEVDEWLDFGHLLTYHQSKKELLVSRAFNSIRVENEILTKSSKQKSKMQFEHSWFKSLPQELRLFTPKVFSLLEGENSNGYEMEYLFFSPISDLFVFGELPFTSWKDIINSCFEVLEKFWKYKPETKEAIDRVKDDCTKFLFKRKVISRLDSFLEDAGLEKTASFTINGEKLGSIEAIINTVLENISDSKDDDICIIHGDFFFGNLLYNFRSKRVVMLDPRGSVNGDDASVYGDIRYDVAKLAHSIVGFYDSLIAKRCSFSKSGISIEFDVSISEQHRLLIEYYLDQIDAMGFNKKEIMAITSSLFFSMLPLHNDDEERQFILFANALRIYQEYIA